MPSAGATIRPSSKPAVETSKPNGHPEGVGGSDNEIARILGISVPISVTLAERPFSLESLTAITVGTILEFETSADAELTLYAASQPVGKGVAVKVGENFGLQVTRIGTLRERIDAFHK